jgi:hypothetical protein
MWQALGRIAGALNGSGILWCVGASVLLHQYGLAEHPHDIDLLVALPDAERAAGILGAMGEEVPCGASVTYSTEFFRRFCVDGCDVDLMAGFRVNHPSGCYEYRFDGASVASVREVGGVPVPFAALEDWCVVYQLIPDKEYKALRIEEYLRQNGIENPGLLARALEGCLPDAVQRRISALLAK